MNSIRSLLLCTAVVLSVAYTAIGQQHIKWVPKPLRAVLDMAQKEDKYVFVDTYTNSCAPCKLMDRELRDPELAAYFNEEFINVKIDMNSSNGQIIKGKYELVFLPTLMILDKYGTVKYKVDKVISASELLYKGRLVAEQGMVIDDASSISSSPVPSPHKRDKTSKTELRPAASTTLPPQKGETAPVDIVSEDKILFVLDGRNGNVPPDILKQEAYFRMELADGSHHDAAKRYLETQKDWSTTTNIRFIYDFLHTANGKPFGFFIANQQLFEELVGKDKVKLTKEILVNKRLSRGFPRPDLIEAKMLYSLLDPSTSTLKAYQYSLDLLLTEGRKLAYLSMIPEYILELGTADHERVHQAAAVFIDTGRPRVAATTDQYIGWLDQIITSTPDIPQYYQTLAWLHYLEGNKKVAAETARRAIEVAANHDIVFTLDDRLRRKLDKL